MTDVVIEEPTEETDAEVYSFHECINESERSRKKTNTKQMQRCNSLRFKTNRRKKGSENPAALLFF